LARVQLAVDADIACGACVGSAGWGAVAIYRGAPNITLIALIAASAWFLAALWLARRRNGWRPHTGHTSPTPRDDRECDITQVPQLIRLMKLGGVLLMILGLAVLFVP
jgi:hypothetical protein